MSRAWLLSCHFCKVASHAVDVFVVFSWRLADSTIDFVPVTTDLLLRWSTTLIGWRFFVGTSSSCYILLPHLEVHHFELRAFLGLSALPLVYSAAMKFQRCRCQYLNSSFSYTDGCRAEESRRISGFLALSGHQDKWKSRMDYRRLNSTKQACHISGSRIEQFEPTVFGACKSTVQTHSILFTVSVPSRIQGVP